MQNTSKILALVLVVMTLIVSLTAINASAATETVTKVFESKDLGVYSSAGNWTDSQEVLAGTDEFFTLIMSAKVKTDGSDKKFEDGYVSSPRVNWGGKSDFSKKLNMIKFTVPSAATVKVWWACGDAGRTVAVWDETGSAVATSTDETVKNSPYIDTFEIASAGTYYLACPKGSNYIFKVEVSWTVQTEGCDHEGGTATCTELAVCTKCGEGYGALAGHTGGTATCKAKAVCDACGQSYGELADHEGGTATCQAKAVCENCNESYGELGWHVLTFVTTAPTSEVKGKTTASCSLCDFTFVSGEVSVLGEGTHEFLASDIEAFGKGTYFDGEVVVYGGEFAAHVSGKTARDTSKPKDFDSPDYWTGTDTFKLGGGSELLTNGEGENEVWNGGYANYIEFTTVSSATVKVYWVANGDGRQVGIYDLEGKLVAVTTADSVKNGYYYSELTLEEAGTYLLGTEAEDGGSNNIYRLVVEVAAPEVEEPDVQEPTTPEEPTAQPTIWEQIVAFIMSIIAKIRGFLKV